MNRRLKTLEKTVVLVSLPLTKIKAEVLGRIYKVYGRILIETLEYMWNNNITSWTRAKKVLYRKFRKKYEDIPSITFMRLYVMLLRGLRVLGSLGREDWLRLISL